MFHISVTIMGLLEKRAESLGGTRMTERRRLLELALKGLEADQASLQKEIAAIQRELGAGQTQPATPSAAHQPTTKGKHLSAAHRKKISAAMKQRYAQKLSAAAPAGTGARPQVKPKKRG